MKKILLASILCISFLSYASAQIAVDFTANDCNGNPHNLYNTLDSGKVIVIAFVMPCGSCISASLAAYNQSQSYTTSNPGKVMFYLSDDVANTACSALNGWAAQYNIGPNLFAFSTTDLDQNNFGQAGMPKIVVVGGSSHTIYFNQNDGAADDVDAIEATINLALSEIAGLNESVANTFSLELFPNPASGKINLSFVITNHDVVTVQLLNSIGQVINETKNENAFAGLNQISFSTGELPTGIYFVRLSAATGYSVKKFIVE